MLFCNLEQVLHMQTIVLNVSNNMQCIFLNYSVGTV